MKKKLKTKINLIVAGGVAANKTIRENLSNLAKEMDFKTYIQISEFCGDNAAMIAWAGIQRFKKNLRVDNVVSAKSRWPLDEKSSLHERTRFKIMKQYWLIKSEPDVWSIDQQKIWQERCTWDGVRNYQAANNLKK